MTGSYTSVMTIYLHNIIKISKLDACKVIHMLFDCCGNV